MFDWLLWKPWSLWKLLSSGGGCGGTGGGVASRELLSKPAPTLPELPVLFPVEDLDDRCEAAPLEALPVPVWLAVPLGDVFCAKFTTA